jgi:hypothetical protein
MVCGEPLPASSVTLFNEGNERSIPFSVLGTLELSNSLLQDC